jgi:hypothetical protein
MDHDRDLRVRGREQRRRRVDHAVHKSRPTTKAVHAYDAAVLR